MILRPYQQECVESVFRELESNSSTLVVMPTSAGKTVTFAGIISKFQPSRVLVLAHRKELIYQAKDKIQKVTGLSVEIEMGEHRSSQAAGLFHPVAQIIVSTIQTQISGNDGNGRMTKFDPHDFGLVIIDECHHAVSRGYKKVINYYRQNPNIKVIGFTASPDRSDEEALGQIFDTVAYDYEILDAINDGWVIPVEQQMVEVEDLNFEPIDTTAGDLNSGQLSELMTREKPMHGVISSTIDIVGSKRGIGFAVSVEQARICSEIMNRHKAGMSHWICGKTPKEERPKILSDFANGSIQFLWNCGVLCLDDKTEILTSEGWIGIEGMTYQHKVANWDNGNVFFKEPNFIVRRDRHEGEKMVVLETKNRSIRVTGDHRMLFKKYSYENFEIVHASDLVGKRGFLPISGEAKEFELTIEDGPELTEKQINRNISANSYTLRKLHGYSDLESKIEARKRILTDEKLKYTQPKELTNDDCKLIGYWLGDGSVGRGNKGGLTYTLCQAARDKNICAEVSRLLESCGFDYKKRFEKNICLWSMPRGTGFGNQKRNGFYRIEPYLKKFGTNLFWALNQSQFDSLVAGFWMADGEHYDFASPNVPIMRISNTKKPILDLLQAIACVRGYRASITTDKVRNPNANVLYHLSLTKRTAHEMTKYRLQFEDGWKPERVWCVTSDTGNIITRRRGTVVVTGNTEGFDDTGVEIISMARPTKSRALYAQMAGRAFRPHHTIASQLGLCPAAAVRRAMIARSVKPSALIIDFVGNSGRHKLMTTADILGGKVSDEVIEAAVKRARQQGGKVRMDKAIEEEERRIEERKKREQEEIAKKEKLKAKAKFSSSKIDPFDIFQVKPTTPRGWDRAKSISKKMKDMLERSGIKNVEELGYAKAKQLCGTIIDRWNKNLCSFGQAKLLTKFGYEKAGEMTFQQAKATITAVKNNGWRKVELSSISTTTNDDPY